MLTEKQNLKENDVFVAKLVSGEEVIGKVVHIENDKYVKITKPLVLNLMPHPNTRDPIIVPTPWSLGIDEDQIIKIDFSKIIFITKARQEIVSSYIKATTGLEIPKSGKI